MKTADRSVETATIVDGDDLLEVVAVTDRGRVREENQDACIVSPLSDGHGCAFLVADGMGGHVGGREAAEVAIRAAIDELRAASEPLTALESAFTAADRAVGISRGSGPLRGTTLVAALVSARRCLIGNVGDSRAYVLSDCASDQLTRDHSVLEERLRGHPVTRSKADLLPLRNLLTRAVTGDGAPADFVECILRPDDVLVLCSDGLWGWLEPQDLCGFLTGPEPLEFAAERACDSALDAGSTDNVTLVACKLRIRPQSASIPGDGDTPATPPAPSDS